MSNRPPARRAPRSEEERLLRGRLLGRRVELLDGRAAVLQAVWFSPTTRKLACLVQLGRVAVWIDADEIRIPAGAGSGMEGTP